MAQSGDIINTDGSIGRSISGKPFEDENFIATHTEEGLIAMQTHGPNTNLS